MRVLRLTLSIMVAAAISVTLLGGYSPINDAIAAPKPTGTTTSTSTESPCMCPSGYGCDREPPVLQWDEPFAEYNPTTGDYTIKMNVTLVDSFGIESIFKVVRNKSEGETEWSSRTESTEKLPCSTCYSGIHDTTYEGMFIPIADPGDFVPYPDPLVLQVIFTNSTGTQNHWMEMQSSGMQTGDITHMYINAYDCNFYTPAYKGLDIDHCVDYPDREIRGPW